MAVVPYDVDVATRRWRDVAVPTVRFRQSQQSPLIQACIAVATRYNAEYVIPLAGNEPDDPQPVLTPALVNEAVDIPAMRAASTMPSIDCPWLPDAEGIVSNKRRKRAETRRKVLAATWHRSNFDLLLGRYFRQLAGYGFASALVQPVLKHRNGPFAQIGLRNALTTYADPTAPEDIDVTNDVGFVHQLSASAVRSMFPESQKEKGGIIPPPERLPNDSEMYDVLEWMDNDWTLIGIIGKTRTTTPERVGYGGEQLLKAYPNRLGFVPAVVSEVVTLDKLVSRLTHMIGKADTVATLLRLDIEMMKRTIAPDRYVIGTDERTPKIVSNMGNWADGWSGKVNLLENVASIGELSGKPDPNNLARIQFIEGNARTETGISGAVGGSTAGMAGALRTGRGIDSMLAASVDPRIAEMQRVAGKALTVLNECVLETYKTYWPSRKFSMYSGWPSDRGMIDFVPKDDIETSENCVYYPMPGTDGYQQTVEIAQMLSTELISRKTARTLHPNIDDADQQEREIQAERVRTMLWGALAQRMQTGGIPPIDAARMIQLFNTGMEIEDVITKVDEEARKRQAGQQAEEQGPGEPPALPPGAAQQPGLGSPGEGSEAGPPGGGEQITPQALMAALAQQPAPAQAGAA